jgi:signal transduction histidine kinase
MRLRNKLLITFITLGAAPLLVVGGVTNYRNQRAVERLVADQTARVASRVSRELSERHAIRLGDVLFLAENTETLRLLGGGGLPPAFPGNPSPKEFLAGAWVSLAGVYQWVQLRDAGGEVVLALGNAPTEPAPGTEPGEGGEIEEPINGGTSSSSGASVLLVESILDPASGDTLGSVVAALNPAAVFPADLGDRGFGTEGWVAVLSTETGRSLYPPPALFRDPASPRPLPDLPEVADRTPPGGSTLSYQSGDRPWVASLVPVPGTPWTVVSASALEEFSVSFTDAGRANALLVVLITLAVSAAFLVITLRTTHSLEGLTAAAEKVAGGNLDPALPSPTGDEVGTLSLTFRIMLDRIAGMIRQVEESRQLAAVGEFSAQIAHELRNPLAAIRMSIQGLHRRLAGTEHGRSLEIALEETDRLDRVARGVLSLGRRAQGARRAMGALRLVEASVRAMAPELEEMGVRVEVQAPAEELEVLVQEEGVRGAIVNLLKNAAEAMPEGGQIFVTLARGEEKTVEIHVEDEGPGIPAHLRPRIFDPFVTTKARGNGFGLPLALKAAEEAGGTLELRESAEGGGAHFVLRLPRHAQEEGQ